MTSTHRPPKIIRSFKIWGSHPPELLVDIICHNDLSYTRYIMGRCRWCSLTFVQIFIHLGNLVPQILYSAPWASIWCSSVVWSAARSGWAAGWGAWAGPLGILCTLLFGIWSSMRKILHWILCGNSTSSYTLASCPSFTASMSSLKVFHLSKIKVWLTYRPNKSTNLLE